MPKYKSLFEWCQAYRKVGWSVIPLYNYTKVPNLVEYKDDNFGFLPGWTIFQNRHATDEEVNYWFKDNKVTGIGVVTGKISNIVVVDEDSYKANGMKFEFLSDLRTKTGRGGRHHFFQYKEDIKTSGFKKGVNIEIKSDGGFVILPPTKVWVNENKTKQGEYIWESFCKMDKLSVITKEQLAKYQRGDGKSIDMHELLEAQLGEQHISIRTIALKTFARFPKKEWDIAEKFIREEAARFTPPHPLRRIDIIIRDCKKFISTHSDDEIQNQIEKPVFLPRSVREVADERMAEKELEKIAPKTGYPELDRIIKGWVPGHLVTLTAGTNVGKSSLCCNIADRVRLQKKRVLYFALEPENTVVDYLASARTGKHFDELTYEDISFDDEYIHIYGKQEIATLEDMINVIRASSIRYDLIIIDHIGYFIRDKRNTIQEQANTIKDIVGLAKERKSCVIIIAHLKKLDSGVKKYMPTFDDISGSAAFKQDSTEVLILNRDRMTEDPKDTRLALQGTLIVAKTKAGPNGYMELFFSDKSGRIMTREEVQNSSMSESKKLSLLGFSDSGLAPLPMKKTL